MTYSSRFRFYSIRQIILGLLGMTFVTPAYSQTTFTPPSDSVNVSQYQTIWECLVASSRMEKSIEAESGILIDTLEPEDHVGQKMLPMPVIELARRCGTQTFRANEPSKDIPYYIRLYLKAGQDSLAIQMARRHFVTIAQGDTAARNLYLREIISELTSSTPARLSLAWEYLNVFDSVTNGQFHLSLISGFGTFLEAAEENDDSVQALSAAQRIVAIVDRLTEKDRSQKSWSLIMHMAQRAYEVIYGTTWLDSLKHAGTERYVELLKVARAKVTGQHSTSVLLGGVGEKAPTVIGDYWFPQKPAYDVPSTKTISLVMFLDQRYVRARNREVYLRTFASLRRLKQQFPKLDVVIMTRTLGWFGESSPPEVEREAALLASWIRDFYKIDAVVSVSKTSFFRLPGVDRRRINQDTENEQHYSFGSTVDMQGFPAFITDLKGTIVLQKTINKGTEKEFVSILRTLYSQTTQGIR